MHFQGMGLGNEKMILIKWYVSYQSPETRVMSYKEDVQHCLLTHDDSSENNMKPSIFLHIDYNT